MGEPHKLSEGVQALIESGRAKSPSGAGRSGFCSWSIGGGVAAAAAYLLNDSGGDADLTAVNSGE